LPKALSIFTFKKLSVANFHISSAPGITGNYPTSPPDPPTPEPPIIVDPPPIVIPPPRPQGIGARIYVSTAKGVAVGNNATFPSGSYTWTAINSGLGSAAAKTILTLNLDPFSHDGTQFTAAYAMTDDGFYRCTGLDGAPTWAQKFTAADADTLLGLSGCGLQPGFTVSVHTAGVVVCVATKEYTPSHFFGQAEWRHYICYSTDYGTTWNADVTKFVSTYVSMLATYNLWLAPSYHIAGTFYLSSSSHTMAGNQDNVSGFAPNWVNVMRSTALPTFAPALQFGVVAGRTNGALSLPFCDSSGAPYANDNRAYLHAIENFSTGVNAIVRYDSAFDPIFSAGYTPPSYMSVGDDGMTAGSSIANYPPFIHAFNENRIIVLSLHDQLNKLWTTLDGGTLWTEQTPSVAGRTHRVRNLFPVPASDDAFFLIGEVTAGGGTALVAHTQDYGTTFTDVSNYGLAGALDTVLGLGATDCYNSFVLVDYYKV